MGSIAGIDALYATFLRHWGNRRDYLYYITKFGELKRKSGEYLLDFTKYLIKCIKKFQLK